MTDAFTPEDHTVQGVNDYLATAAPDEVQRVLDAELAGRGRVGILQGPHVPSAAAVEAVTVKLRHHWTDAAGTAHAPGAEVQVSRDTAEQLVGARYATSTDVETPDPTPAAETDTGMTGTPSIDLGDGTTVDATV